MSQTAPFSTGLKSLDAALGGLRPGDNVVWEVDRPDDYRAFIVPFVVANRAAGRPVTYFRFGRHRELIGARSGARTIRLDPSRGFERFVNRIREVIAANGPGAAYVFDSHSELARHFYSDRMLANFFLLTCPYLFELRTVAYFAVLRHFHSNHALQPIHETTQLLIDVYRSHGKRYVQPRKVAGRFSPTLFKLHAWEDGDRFRPVHESPEISEVMAAAPWAGLQSAAYRQIGIWNRQLMEAEELLADYRHGRASRRQVEACFRRLLPQLIASEPRMLALARKYLTLADLLAVWKRMIDCGRIGGKASGMLIARAILCREPRWRRTLEAHDSFYIGTDVFYTFLVLNNCWHLRQKQKDPRTFLEGAAEVRERVLKGRFAEYTLRRFGDMLDYFGQSPIIVRSSSLLEDNYGNAFAGKYESVFCANQGSKEQRLAEFLDAIRTVYASAMSEAALRYRAQRDVLDEDEQMALLVQRVSGQAVGDCFFPHLAGVAFSYNPYVWHESIDPRAGMMRLVVGLGTRAVDRADDDYTRIVALNAPERRPEAQYGEETKYAQRRVDLLDLTANRFTSRYFLDLAREHSALPLTRLAREDEGEDQWLRDAEGNEVRPWRVDFERLFQETAFLDDIRGLLASLRRAYNGEVDVEFAANFLRDGSYRINLLQCRPLQVRVGDKAEAAAARRAPRGEAALLEARGGVIGHSRCLELERIVFVVPEAYASLSEQARYQVARLVGKLTHLDGSEAAQPLLLVGPGRWGTRMPSLGVPVTFAEISTATALCEIDAMHAGLVPDLSLGTHFFNEMVENDMLYLAFYRARRGNSWNESFFRTTPNRLAERLPAEASWEEVVRVIEPRGADKLFLLADSLKQTAVLYEAGKSAARNSCPCPRK